MRLQDRRDDRDAMLTAEPSAFGSNRHAATRVEGPDRHRLAIECDVDVCVIGAGLAGLTVALEVARRGWSVVVLEAQSIAWSASGRSAGVVTPGFAASPDAVVARVGLDHAKALWALSVDGAEYIRREARGMPGVELSEAGWLHVARTDDIRPMAHEAAMASGEFGVAVEPWATERVRETLRSPRYFHGLHYPSGFSLHPLNYALGLAAAAEALGVRIFEHTPAVEIDPAGVRKRVVTADARVRAAHVVLAGSVHLQQLAPHFANTLTPLYAAAIASAPLGEPLAEAIRYPGSVGDGLGRHHRVLADGRLLWSDGGAVRPGAPKRRGAALARQVARTYPSLGAIKVEHAWIGAAGATVHGMPQIGEVSPGLWLLSGFGLQGLNTTAMGGEIVARGIVEGDPAWKAFAPFELVWAGGGLGRAVKQVFGWTRRVRARIGAIQAQRRHERRRRAALAELASMAAAQAAANRIATVPPAAVPNEPPVFEPPLAVAPVVPMAVAELIHEAVSEPEAPPGITEGQSGGAAPPIPEPDVSAPVAPVEAVQPMADPPIKPKRKRGKKRKVNPGGQAASREDR